MSWAEKLPADWRARLAALDDRANGCLRVAETLDVPYPVLLDLRKQDAEIDALCKRKMRGSGRYRRKPNTLPDGWRERLSKVHPRSINVHYAAALDVSEIKFYDLRNRHPELAQFLKDHRNGHQ